MERLLINLLRRLASAQALAIVDLLVKDPTGWKRSKHRLTHERAQIDLWVSNHVYGLHLAQMVSRDPPYKRMSYADRKLIWMHTTKFKWIDPPTGDPRDIVRRVAETLSSNAALPNA